MLVKEVIQKTTDFFSQKGLTTPRLDAEILVSHALGWRRLDVFLKFDLPLKEQELEKCRALVKRRSTGEPVAYITQVKDFYNSTFHVEPGVLIPRPETEMLVEKGLDFLKASGLENPLVLDFGCGSGCIGLSIIKEFSSARLVGFDISEKAVQVARHNAEKLGLQERSTFLNKRVEDISPEDWRGDQVALIVANPPYIDPSDSEIEENVVKFEPKEALFSEEEGLLHIREWFLTANSILSGGSGLGLYLCEMGSGQGSKVKALTEKMTSQKQISIYKDLSQHDRVLAVHYSQK